MAAKVVSIKSNIKKVDAAIRADSERFFTSMVTGLDQGMQQYKGHIQMTQMTGRPGLKAPTGNLRRSWRVRTRILGPTMAGVILGTNVKYAKIHQTGGKIRHPGGTPYIVINKGGTRKAVFMRKDGDYPRGTKFTKPHDITIPKRLHIPEKFKTTGVRMIKDRIRANVQLILKSGKSK